MEWIRENIAEIFAALFALYAAARTIVALTPTQKDDNAVEKAGAFLTTVAKIFGLDITQGRDLKK